MTAGEAAPGAPALRALVLGGSGFLGQHIVHALRAGGVAAVSAGRRSGGRPDCVRLDVLSDSEDELRVAITRSRPDVVINCVGRTSGTAAELVDGNVIAPARILHSLARIDPCPRLIHIGSAGEYGAVPVGARIREDTPEFPASPYGVTKLSGTRLLLSDAADAGVPVVVLRVFNPIGPGAPSSSLPGRTARLLRDALARGPHADVDMAPLDGYRDWVDVRDVGDAVVAVTRGPRPISRLYNVGSGRAVCSRDLVRQIAAEAGFHAAVREERVAPGRSAAVPWQQADITRAGAELRWQPRRPLSESIGDMWRSTGRAGATPPG